MLDGASVGNRLTEDDSRVRGIKVTLGEMRAKRGS
jgi:hypothetical protein